MSTGIQGPPLEDHPGQLWKPSSRPSRPDSSAANRMSDHHSSLSNFTGPSTGSWPTLKMKAPPRPTRFIDSRSAVIPSRLTQPLIQCHQVFGFADSGGV